MKFALLFTVLSLLSIHETLALPRSNRKSSAKGAKAASTYPRLSNGGKKADGWMPVPMCPANTVNSDWTTKQEAVWECNPVMSASSLANMIKQVGSNMKKVSSDFKWTNFAAYILASSAVESGGGKVGHFLNNDVNQPAGRPFMSEQKARKDSTGKSKWQAGSQEIGLYRMNRDMILVLAPLLGRSNAEKDILLMDGMNSKNFATSNPTKEGDQLATIYMYKALDQWGTAGFTKYHRDGMPRVLPNARMAMDSSDVTNTKFGFAYATVNNDIVNSGYMNNPVDKIPYMNDSGPAQ